MSNNYVLNEQLKYIILSELKYYMDIDLRDDIINNQIKLYEIYNINYKIRDKIDFILIENENNYWEIWPYYLYGIFSVNYPFKLIPYIKWKINNIEQRL